MAITNSIRVLSFPGSSAIGEVRYDMDAKTMKVRFPRTRKDKDGKWLASTWEFTGIEPHHFADFAIADSPGGYFNQYIRDYPSTRVSPPPEPAS